MDKEIIIPLAKRLSAGNVDFAVLLGWRAIADREKFRDLGNNEVEKAEEMMLLGVNQQCGTSFKRADLVACDDFWHGVSAETIGKIEIEARKVKKIIKMAESAS